MANKRDSGNEVVHECLIEGGDSKSLLLGAPEAEATRQLTCFLG